MIHHKLKTPLTSIKGCAQLMQRRERYSDWAIEAIIREADILTRALDRLLEALSLETSQFPLQYGNVDLVDVARSVAERAKTDATCHTIRLEAPARPLIGWWDGQAVQRVVEELITNALAYSPRGGEVQVRVDDRDDFGYLAVADHGVGIPPEALPRIFDRFYRVDEPKLHVRQGLGLGLYTTKLLIEAHGGRVWAESHPGQGSAFSIALPYRSPTLAANAGQEAPA